MPDDRTIHVATDHVLPSVLAWAGGRAGRLTDSWQLCQHCNPILHPGGHINILVQAFDNRQLEDRIENTSLLSLYTCPAQQLSLFSFYIFPHDVSESGPSWPRVIVLSRSVICPFFVQYLLKPFEDETPLLAPILSSHHYIRPAWKYPLSLWILWGFMGTSSVLHEDIWKVLIVLFPSLMWARTI